jgi:hypothetical protein
MFTHEKYALILDQTLHQIEKLGRLKGGEYAGDQDRLANFRRNGEALGLPMEAVWHTYAAKHWDAITQSIRDLLSNTTRERLECLEGRCDDLIVYLILFKCMLIERPRPPEGATPLTTEKPAQLTPTEVTIYEALYHEARHRAGTSKGLSTDQLAHLLCLSNTDLVDAILHGMTERGHILHKYASNQDMWFLK